MKYPPIDNFFKGLVGGGGRGGWRQRENVIKFCFMVSTVQLKITKMQFMKNWA